MKFSCRVLPTLALFLLVLVLFLNLNEKVFVLCVKVSPFVPSRPSQQTILLVSISLRGHAQPLINVAEELSSRGYNVKFASYSDAESWIPDGPIEFEDLGSSPVDEESVRASIETVSNDKNVLSAIRSFINSVYLILAEQTFLSLEEVVEKVKPDLMVIDIATLGAIEAADKFKIPYVLNSPTLLQNLISQNYAWEPSEMNMLPVASSGITLGMSFVEKITCIFFPKLLAPALYAALADMNTLRLKYEMPPYESIEDLLQHSKVLVNSAIGMDTAAYKRPHIHYVGPLTPRVARSNPEDFLESHYYNDVFQWMESCMETKSLVFVNFGHMSRLTPDFLDGVEAGLSGVCTLWAVPRELLDLDFFSRHPSSLPLLVIVSREEVPYWDLLASDKVDVVISHCGIASAQEALLYKKPLICFPFLGDQLEVAARIEEYGAGVQLYYKDPLFSDKLREATENIINDKPEYIRSAAKLASLLEVKGKGIEIAADAIVEVFTSGNVLGINDISKVNTYPGWDILIFAFALLTTGLTTVRMLLISSRSLSLISRKS